MIEYDFNMFLRLDVVLKDDLFELINVVVFLGLEIMDYWKFMLNSEVDCFGILVEYVLNGDFYVFYVFFDFLFDVIRSRLD